MALASDIIQDAYREGNLIPVGAVPTDDENTEGLAMLNRAIVSVYGYELGENLLDWLFPAPQRTAPVAANFPQAPVITLENAPSKYVYPYPPANRRIVFGGVAGTLYFPESPEDGARMMLINGSGTGDDGTTGARITIDGNGRTIGGDPTYTDTFPVSPAYWLYRADLGDWTLITDLDLGDDMPFPEDFDDFWICFLNMRLAPRYDKVTSAETQKAGLDALKRLKTRYRQTAVVTYGSESFPRTNQSFLGGTWWW